MKDFELDLIQWLVEIAGLRLTKNKEHHSPLSLIKGYPRKPTHFRGQPNMRKQVAEFFDQIIEDDPTVIDTEKNAEIHLAIIRGSDDVERLLAESPVNLNLRNPDGKTPAMLAIEHSRETAFAALLSHGPDLSLKESRGGNTALHIAVRKGDAEAAERILEARPGLALVQNWAGQTPYHTAILTGNAHVLKVMEARKAESLSI